MKPGSFFLRLSETGTVSGDVVDVWAISVLPSETFSLLNPLKRSMEPTRHVVRFNRVNFSTVHRTGLAAKRVTAEGLLLFLTEEEAWEGYSAALEKVRDDLLQRNAEYLRALDAAVYDGELKVLKSRNRS